MSTSQRVQPGEKVPVLIWVYHGAYILGTKELFGDPARFIESADNPMI